MGPSPNLKIKVGADTSEFSAGMKRAKSGLEGFNIGAGNVSKALTGLVAKFASFTALAKVFADAAKTMAEFERANATLASVLRTNVGNLQDMIKGARELGRTTEFTARDVTQLQTELARLGFGKADILAMEESVLKFASAVGTDLASAAAFTGGSLRAFGLQASDAGHLLDIMANSTAKSALSFEKLQTALGIVFPIAKTFGLSVEDTIAMLGTLSNVLPDASSAATAFRNILLNLANDNGKLAKGLGHTAKTFPEILDAFKELSERGVNLNEVLGMSDTKSAAALASFINNTDALRDLRDALGESTGAVDEMYGTMTNNLIGSVNSLKSAWEGLTLTFSESTGPMKQVVDWLTQSISKLTNWIEAVESARRHSRAFDDAMRELIESGNPAGGNTGGGYNKRNGITDGVHSLSEIDPAVVTADSPAPQGTIGTKHLTDKEKKALEREARKNAAALEKTLKKIADDYTAIAAYDVAMEEMGNEIAGRVATQIGVTASGFSQAERQLAELLDLSDQVVEGLDGGFDLDIQNELDAFVDSLEDAVARTQALKDEFISAVVGGFSSGVQELTDQLFGLKETNPGSILYALLSPLADIAIKEGELLMVQGLGIEAVKESLSFLTGVPAIAAGATLIAIGSAVKSGLAALANSGGYSSAVSMASSAPIASSQYGSGNDYAIKEVVVNVTGTLQADGDQLVAVISNTQDKNYYTT